MEESIGGLFLLVKGYMGRDIWATWALNFYPILLLSA
jgi:hypothetical protein